MMTKEEVAQVIAYCDENKISYKQRLEELGINPWSFYDAKRKYAPKEEGENAGEFLQLVPGGSVTDVEVKCWAAGIPPERVIVVGDKSFGENNGHVYAKRFRHDYFEQRVQPEGGERFLERNCPFESEYDMTIEKLISECTAYDYKEMLEESKPKSWLKSVSAFANTLGGSLLFGVDNNGLVRGLEDIQHVTEAISLKIRDYMDPIPDVEMIPLVTEGKHVLQVKVKEGVYTPYYYVGDGQRLAFVRNGDESLPATAEQMVRLVLKGSNRTYDSLRTDKKVEDYSFAILANSFRERVQQDWDKKYLLSFGLVTDDGYLTNAGGLFADDCWLSQSRLYCTRWDGLEKDDAINDAEFKGNILLLLREAMAFVKANTRKGWEKLPDGRKNKPEYAERAVLEACVNHLIHRDYTVMGGEVHLDIYDDRLVLTSPGGMYSGQLVQDLSVEEVSSMRRNPVLADVMAQLDYMEKRGSGLKKICNATKELESYNEERRPAFKSSSAQFMTTIYSMEYGEGESNQVVTKQSLSSHQVVVKLSSSIPMVYDLLGMMIKPMSAKEMRQFCGLKDATYFKTNIIDALIEGGLVAMTQPNSPNSPTQKYYLTELGKALLENNKSEIK